MISAAGAGADHCRSRSRVGGCSCLEPAVPQITIGQGATGFTDAGGPGIAGTIGYISPKAEFTPRNVQTAEERSKLVYRVRINVDNKDGVLKQGMHVEAEIALNVRH